MGADGAALGLRDLLREGEVLLEDEEFCEVEELRVLRCLRGGEWVGLLFLFLSLLARLLLGLVDLCFFLLFDLDWDLLFFLELFFFFSFERADGLADRPRLRPFFFFLRLGDGERDRIGSRMMPYCFCGSLLLAASCARLLGSKELPST